MTPEVAVDLFRSALWLTTVMVAVLVVPSLLVGLLVAMFQAATQINEQTMTFIPKIVAVFVTLLIFGPWIIELLVTFTTGILEQIATIGR